MTSPGDSAPFDPTAAAAQLIGTWSYPEAHDPLGVAYLHFHENGIAYQFVHNSANPERRFPLRLGYSVEVPGLLRTHNLKGGSAGPANPYQLNGDTLIITNPRTSYHCTRVPPEEVPTWFQESLAKYVLRT